MSSLISVSVDFHTPSIESTETTETTETTEIRVHPARLRRPHERRDRREAPVRAARRRPRAEALAAGLPASDGRRMRGESAGVARGHRRRARRSAAGRLRGQIHGRADRADPGGRLRTPGAIGASRDARDAARTRRRGRETRHRDLDFRPTGRTFFKRRRRSSPTRAGTGSTPIPRTRPPSSDDKKAATSSASSGSPASPSCSPESPKLPSFNQYGLIGHYRKSGFDFRRESVAVRSAHGCIRRDLCSPLR